MNNDLISRKWLTDAIRNRRTYLSYEDAKDVIDLIDNAPTVDLWEMRQEATENALKKAEMLYARPQGEWIVLVDADNIQTCKCSICGRMVDIANREFDKFPYCHCGAKMKGGADMRGETSVCQNPKGNCFTCKLFEVCNAKTKPADMRGDTNG